MPLPFTDRQTARIALAVAALLLCPGAAAAAQHPKPVHTKLTAADEREAIEVKFVDGADVRLRGGRLGTQAGGRIAALDELAARFPGLRFSRVFASTSEERLAAVRRQAIDRSHRAQADMNLYFRVRTRSATDTVALVDALNALDMVELATPVTKAPPPPATPSLVSGQGYRSAASGGGIDADFAQTLPGGKGENVTVVDVEYSWNRSHEDLSKARAGGAALANGTACDPFNNTDHGTAVLGEIVGDANDLGVTGLAPGTTLRTVNASRLGTTGACEWNPADAILLAADNTAPGDVILIEQQTQGPRWPGGTSQFGYLPLEWQPAVRTAIESATARGRIVVEAAGNGSQDLDDPLYQGRFATDSGAIMVGAGNAPGCTYPDNPTIARGRLSFSNYGSRLNLQGWGDCVTSTGYGKLLGVSGGDTAYTGVFSGTSSASPIVAASAAVLSSVAKARGATLTPPMVRTTLRATGQPQAFGNPGAIGPLPNLRAAIDTLGPKLAESRHVIGGTALHGTTVPVVQSWSNTGTPAASYDVFLRTDGGDWVRQASATATATFDLAPNHSYQFAARAVDAGGVWSDWAYGTAFRLDQYQEDYTSSNPLMTGSWTRSAWQPASGGFVSVSATAGDRATFSFTGSSVAWIGTKATNRGEARVSVDGAPPKTVELYSPTTLAQAIADAESWTQSGPHQITVEVVGTPGRPKVDIDAFVRLR